MCRSLRYLIGYWLELQVDRSDDAVTELVKKYAELEHAAKGASPAGKKCCCEKLCRVGRVLRGPPYKP